MEIKYSGLNALSRFLENCKATFAAITHKHTKSDITDFPTIPTKTSDLTNDSGFVTTDTTYSAATTSGNLGLVKTGGDVTISSGVITVNDDSHAHTIANVDGLQGNLDSITASIAELDESKSDTGHTHTVANISDLSVSADELNYMDGVTSNVQTQLNSLSSTVSGKAPSSHNHTITASASDDDVVVLAGTNGSNKVTYTASHATSGVTAGTYKSVTVNKYGHVTGGTNPTTLSGYGITDAASQAELDELAETVSGKSDEGHTHTISNVTNLQSSLDTKVPTTRTVNGKALSANISLTASDVGADASGAASSALASAKSYSDTNLQTAKDYTDSEIASLINSAPTTLDTLGEIAAAMEENADVVEALETAIGTKAASDHTHSNYTSTVTTTGSGNAVTAISKSGNTVTVTKGTTFLTAHQNAFSKVTVGDTTVTADAAGDTLTLVAGSNVTLTPDATNDKITIAAKDTTYSAATTSAAGLMSAADKTKLNSITESADSVSFSRSLTSGTKVGTITINGTGTDLYAPTNTDTHYTTGLKVGASATATANAAASNGSVYLNVLDNTIVRDSHKIVGSGSVTVASDADGVITINGVNTTYTSLKNPYALTIQGNGTTLTNGTYDGSAAKTINITPSSIGAATSSHTHSSYVNQNAFSNVIVGDTTIAADTTTDTLTIVAGSNITLTPDATNDKLTIAATNTTYSAGDGLSLSSNKFSLATSGASAGSYGVSAATTLAHSGSFNVPYVTVDTYGRVTSIKNVAVTLPASGNTDTKVTNTLATTTKFYLTGTSSATTNTGTQYFDTGVYVSATAGELVATKFTGTLSGNASTATKIKTPVSLKIASAAGTTGTDFDGSAGVSLVIPSTLTGFTSITATNFVGTASKATQLATARTIDGVSFNGTAAIIHYGTCSTAAATVAKVVSVTGFTLVTGARVLVKFTVTNTAASPTLNVNSTGAKAIMYRGSAISASYLAANRVYEFVYDGTDYELVGDINTNTTYSAGTGISLSGTTFSNSGVRSISAGSNGVISVNTGGTSANVTCYTLPTASSTLGGVKTTSTVTSTSGYTACPIISGVPYYKDTNTTYTLSSFGVTATAAELNKLDGCTATVTELNYVDGVTSNIQTQINAIKTRLDALEAVTHTEISSTEVGNLFA